MYAKFLNVSQENLFLKVSIDYIKKMSMNEMHALQFNLKFVSKQLAKASKKSLKEEGEEKKKCLQAMHKGYMENARVFAESAIRKKNEALNQLRLSARVEAVASRLEGALRMQTVARSMGMMVKGMEKAMNQMNPEMISSLMDQFEKQFETMDVVAQSMDAAIGQSVAVTTPEDEVTTLMSQVADENNLDIRSYVQENSLPNARLPTAADTVKEDDDFEARFEALKMRK